MGFDVKIYDLEASPTGAMVLDLPDGFLTAAIMHARKSPNRFPLFSRIADGLTTFQPDERAALKAEWLVLESLAIGPKERAKWNQIFKALNRGEAFQGMDFAGTLPVPQKAAY